jgi:hypothetical protein
MKDPGELEYWRIGVLENWSIGELEYWSIGVMDESASLNFFGGLDNWRRTIRNYVVIFDAPLLHCSMCAAYIGCYKNSVDFMRSHNFKQ